MSDALIVRPEATLEFSPEQVMSTLNKVTDLMQKVLKQSDDGDGDYGVIPGTKKPTLFKAGAEKLCMMFRFAPVYRIEQQHEGPHLTVVAYCELHHIHTNALVGSGIGLCSSKESKYAYREQKKTCPKCNKETIFKSKPPQTGWYCWSKKGGCGEKYPANEPRIESQATGRIANEDVADQHNTVVKMACKRAYIDATLKATAASSIFTQDVDDSDERRTMFAGAEDATLSGHSPEPVRSGGATVIEQRPENAPDLKMSSFLNQKDLEEYQRLQAQTAAVPPAREANADTGPTAPPKTAAAPMQAVDAPRKAEVANAGASKGASNATSTAPSTGFIRNIPSCPKCGKSEPVIKNKFNASNHKGEFTCWPKAKTPGCGHYFDAPGAESQGKLRALQGPVLTPYEKAIVAMEAVDTTNPNWRDLMQVVWDDRRMLEWFDACTIDEQNLINAKYQQICQEGA